MAELPTSRRSELTFYAVCVVYLFYVVLLITNTPAYLALDGENSLNEWLGALALLGVSVMMFLCGQESRKNPAAPRFHAWTFYFMAVLFFWAFGEEISWGQHLTEHATPAWLMDVNKQQETNLHNINKKFFDRTQERVVTLLSLVTVGFHLKGKERLWGFRLPEAPLNLAFILLPFYRRFDNPALDVWQLGLIAFVLYLVMAWRQKDFKTLKMGLSLVLVAVVLIYFHRHYTHLFGRNSNAYHEVRETVFSLLCLVYAVQFWCDAKIKSAATI